MFPISHKQCGLPSLPFLTFCQDRWADTMCERSPTTFQGPAQPAGWQPRLHSQSPGFCQRASEKATFLCLVFGEAFNSIFSLNGSLGGQGAGEICGRADNVSLLLGNLHWLSAAYRIKDPLFGPRYQKPCKILYPSTSSPRWQALPAPRPPCILGGITLLTFLPLCFCAHQPLPRNTSLQKSLPRHQNPIPTSSPPGNLPLFLLGFPPVAPTL